MKITTSKILVIVFVMLTTIGRAQTMVSGAIASNTLWTLAGSPYIVTDNVTVNPGITLSIQPGVIVKFNAGKLMDLQQSRLIANGTAALPILFTSNASLTAGAWNRIVMSGGTMTSSFNHCEFKYAQTALFDNRGGVSDTIIVRNCNFNNNITGINCTGTSMGMIDSSSFTNNTTSGISSLRTSTLNYCDFFYNQTGISSMVFNTLNNCTFGHNQTGMDIIACCHKINNSRFYKNQTGIIVEHRHARISNTTIDSNTVAGISIAGRTDTIMYCTINYNGIGINDSNGDTWPNIISNNIIESNSTGMQLSSMADHIYCNKICSNTAYDLYYDFSGTADVSNNYWCTADSASTAAVIYDGHDNINYGVVDFMPLDVSNCYLATGIHEHSQHLSFEIFPNPATNRLTIELPPDANKAEIHIFDSLGKEVYVSKGTEQQVKIDVSLFNKGVYFIEVIAGDKIYNQKFIRQ